VRKRRFRALVLQNGLRPLIVHYYAVARCYFEGNEFKNTFTYNDNDVLQLDTVQKNKKKISSRDKSQWNKRKNKKCTKKNRYSFSFFFFLLYSFRGYHDNRSFLKNSKNVAQPTRIKFTLHKTKH
jgi:hypothetical protein